jgi:Family of unknown function (DUF6318)
VERSRRERLVFNGLLVLLAVTAVLATVSIYQLIAGSDGDGVSQPPTATSAGPTGATGSTSSAPSTSSASPTLHPPPLPAAAAKPTRDGAEAFFKHFLHVYTYTYNSLDTAPLDAISVDACMYCRSAITNVDNARAADKSFEYGAIKITAIVTAPLLDKEDGTVVSVLLDQGKLVVKDRRGHVLEQSPGVKGGRLDALVVWVRDRWMVRGVDIVAKGTT